MSLAMLLAGVRWDPTIRGILVVLVGTTVLMGSTWLLVATNVGARLGTLISFSAFFGWMFIMGVIWWIYGIGWVGSVPTWKPLDINIGCSVTQTAPTDDCGLKVSAVEKARTLVEPQNLQRGYDLVLEKGSEATKKEFTAPIDPARLEGLSPAEQAKATAEWELRNQQTTLSEVAAVDKALANTLEFGGDWRLLSTAQSGEAVATASAEVVAEKFFADPSAFKVLNSFDLGGKVKLNDDPNRGDRIVRKLRTATQIFSPPHYVVVQVQAVVPQTAAPGEAPPRPRLDQDSPVISVIMERDLGNRRLYPFLTALGSLLLFIVSATMLHYRDKEAMARRAAAGTR
jgi:hypothetical protein